MTEIKEHVQRLQKKQNGKKIREKDKWIKESV